MSFTSPHGILGRPDENQVRDMNPASTSVTCNPGCAPGRIRTCDTGFRRAVLYPLSYGG